MSAPVISIPVIGYDDGLEDEAWEADNPASASSYIPLITVLQVEPIPTSSTRNGRRRSGCSELLLLFGLLLLLLLLLGVDDASNNSLFVAAAVIVFSNVVETYLSCSWG